jgi:hypothetical protein
MHERREARVRETIVEGLVGCALAEAMVERPLKIRQRLGMAAGQSRYDREEQTLRRDHTQPFTLAGLATDLIHDLLRQRGCENRF